MGITKIVSQGGRRRKEPRSESRPARLPFSHRITYAFYEQYLTVTLAGIVILALCLIPTFVVCYVLLGMDIRSATINLLTIIMILVDTVGAMTLWGVPYNAISLINLVAVSGA